MRTVQSSGPVGRRWACDERDRYLLFGPEVVQQRALRELEALPFRRLLRPLLPSNIQSENSQISFSTQAGICVRLE